jgi:ElaA protein
MNEGLARCAVQWPGLALHISAQARLRAFYRSLGFADASDEYLEDGMPHLAMSSTPGISARESNDG